MNLADHLNGQPPSLAGRTCDALICQQFAIGDRVEDDANITFLKFDGEWHRLYFEIGLIFWRSGVPEPLPWEVPEKEWRYPHVDVGALANVVGKRLLHYDMRPTMHSAEVCFEFEGGARILIEHKNDRGRYVVA